MGFFRVCVRVTIRSTTRDVRGGHVWGLGFLGFNGFGVQGWDWAFSMFFCARGRRGSETFGIEW